MYHLHTGIVYGTDSLNCLLNEAGQSPVSTNVDHTVKRASLIMDDKEFQPGDTITLEIKNVVYNGIVVSFEQGPVYMSGIVVINKRRTGHYVPYKPEFTGPYPK